MSNDDKVKPAIPQYGTKPRRPGMYLGLFHGRETPMEKMADWGLPGPTIGPLKWVHTTYATDIKIEFESAEDAALYFGPSKRLTLVLAVRRRHAAFWRFVLRGLDCLLRRPRGSRTTRRYVPINGENQHATCSQSSFVLEKAASTLQQPQSETLQVLIRSVIEALAARVVLLITIGNDDDHALVEHVSATLDTRSSGSFCVRLCECAATGHPQTSTAATPHRNT